MPLRLPDKLPAIELLKHENIFVMDESRAHSQEIRPLKIVVLNLMPLKITTETDLVRLLSNTPLQLEVYFMKLKSHTPKNTPIEHMMMFYKDFSELSKQKFDGMIVTGAPIETMAYEDVEYWPEIMQIFDWARTHVTSTLYICWGAQAALYYKYGLRKYRLDRKMFGVFEHVSLDNFHPLMRGLDDKFWVPHSRHTEVRRGDIALIKDLQILSYSEKAGVHLLSDMECRNFFSTGHSEYDRDTLAKEYFRDAEKGLDIDLPENYFPDNDPAKTPEVKWRGAANIIFSNWLNYFVYQRTPYDLSTL